MVITPEPTVAVDTEPETTQVFVTTSLFAFPGDAQASTWFETQRDVVLNERRQNYENRPYGLAVMAVADALFPPDHPYHWLTIGGADDIRAMQLEEVQAFLRTYYHPANASLALANTGPTPR